MTTSGLFHSDYKIYSTIIANRLRSTIDLLVHTDQIGYSPGRNILYSIFTYYLLSTHSNLSKALCFFVDFAKAFNSFNHYYILTTLKTYGFPPFICNHIMALLSQAQSAIHNSPPVDILTGIRQGDPVAGYLFILAIEPLLAYLTVASHPSCQIPGIYSKSVYAYCDDLSITTTNLHAFPHILAILNIFALLSSLRINLNKSSLLGDVPTPTSYQQQHHLDG